MTDPENSNMIEILRGVGWSDKNIVDFQLGVEGRKSIEETIKSLEEDKPEKGNN